MHLYGSPSSPFVRKVVVCAHEGGFRDRIDVLYRTISPLVMDEKVNELNPTGKIPVLVTDDGPKVLSHFPKELLEL